MILRENNPKATQKKNPAGGGAKKIDAKQNLKNAQNLKAPKSRAVCVQTAADDQDHCNEQNGTKNFQT